MKRILSFILSLIFIISCCPLSAIKIGAVPFSGGDGSKENPYLVGTPEALDAVRNDLDAHYLQIADINMSSRGNWEPIQGFKGTYDGGDFAIIGLTINSSQIRNTEFKEYIGLFGYDYQAYYQRIHLTDINYYVSSNDENYNIGGIVGASLFSEISHCSVSGRIKVEDSRGVYVGGLAGVAPNKISYSTNSATIDVSTEFEYQDSMIYSIKCGGISGTGFIGVACTNTGDISIRSKNHIYVGGIFGEDGHSGHEGKPVLSDCINTGNITVYRLQETNTMQRDTYYCIVSGIAGLTRGGIKNAINYGNITAYSYNQTQSVILCGGIIGNNTVGNDCILSGCINASGKIIAMYTDGKSYVNESNAGRICGDQAILSNCYANRSVLVNGSSVTGEPDQPRNGGNISDADLINRSFYKDYDFSITWIINGKLGGAVLRGTLLDNDHGGTAPVDPTPDTTTQESVQPEAPNVNVSYFNEMIYRADHLSSGNMNILIDIATNNLLLTNNYSPSKIIVDAHPQNMHTIAAAWEAIKATVDAADGKASQVLKQSVEKEDLITAYILSAVGAYTEYEYADAVKKNFKHTENLTKILCELNGTYAAGGKEFQDFIAGKEGELEKLLEDYYDKNDATMSKLLKAKKGSSVVSSVISKANDIEDVISEISAYTKLYGVSESTKEALLLMYEVCPEEAKEIKNSLKLAAEIISSANEDMIAAIQKREFLFALHNEASYVATDKLWGYVTDAFVDKCAVAKGYVELAKMQLTVIDKFFGVDARTEQYFKLCALNEIDRIAGLAVNQALINYKDHPNGSNAAVFLAAIELKFGFIDQSYSESIKYSEIITDSGIIQKMENGWRDVFGIEIENSLKNSITEAESAKDALHCTILTSWITKLESESSHIAKNYYEYRDKMYALYRPKPDEGSIQASPSAVTLYSIHCPVTVTVYNSVGDAVAEVGENEVWASGEIAVVYDHGGKEIYFFDEGDYKLVCEGYGEGDMDIEVVNYDKDGNITRTINYNNVPVWTGSMHDLSIYSVSDRSGNILEPDYDSSKKDAVKYKATVNYGLISGYLFEIDAAKGKRIEITAIIPEGYRFVGWLTSNGEVAFEDAKAASTYFFMPEGDVEISAKLKKATIFSPDGKALSAVFIIVAIGTALICIAGGTILFVMKKEKQKKENNQ